MRRNDFSWMIGGAQGSGVDTSANIFAKAAAQGGLQVFGNREYYSNIKGEHSYFRVRLSKDAIHSHVDTVDMLATFDDETVARHAGEVRKDGAIIYDPSLGRNEIANMPTIEPNVSKRLYSELDANGLPHTVDGVLEVARRRGVHIYAIPYMELLKKVGEKIGETSLSSLTRMTNVMAVASSFALLIYPEANVSEAIRKQFKSKPKVAEMNVTAIATAYEYVGEKYNGGFGYRLEPIPTDEKRMFLRGSSTIGIAKILAGCRLQTYYPITPASDESEYLEAHENIRIDSPLASEAKSMDASIAVVQTEDEIAAITMAVGGALTGVRASTSTSGPGFSLMAEGIGWAGINEVPVVVTLYQRGGPSTGLPDAARAGRPRLRPPHRPRGVPKDRAGERGPRGGLLRHGEGLQLRREVPGTGNPHRRQGDGELRPDLPDVRPKPREDRQGRAHQGRHRGRRERGVPQVQADGVGDLPEARHRHQGRDLLEHG